MLHQDKEFSASDVLFNQTIKIFYAVYSSLNFTVAAKKLGITQSAVSGVFQGSCPIFPFYAAA